MTEAERLILRGLSIIMRASFSPNDPEAQAKHFAGMQRDIGPWFTDYVKLFEKDAGKLPEDAPDVRD